MSSFDISNLGAHPAFASQKQVVPLAGFSGAAIALLRTANGARFVRKAAGEPAGNKAVKEQADRQIWLRNVLEGAAEVPKILETGEVDGLYYFDMEFVPSADVNIFLKSAPFDEIKRFSSRIEGLMIHMASRHDENATPPSGHAFIEKLDQIEQRTSGRFDHLLVPLREGFEQVEPLLSAMPATVTHGDLTFENVLVDPEGKLWLIDPIQSPIDHFWMDWSKLFQECEGRWYKHRGKHLSAGITHWLRNRWLSAAAEISPDYPALHHLLLALTFARILPYARSETDVNFVAERVEAFGNASLGGR